MPCCAPACSPARTRSTFSRPGRSCVLYRQPQADRPCPRLPLPQPQLWRRQAPAFGAAWPRRLAPLRRGTQTGPGVGSATTAEAHPNMNSIRSWPAAPVQAALQTLSRPSAGQITALVPLARHGGLKGSLISDARSQAPAGQVSRRYLSFGNGVRDRLAATRKGVGAARSKHMLNSWSAFRPPHTHTLLTETLVLSRSIVQVRSLPAITILQL